jgi:hypothetical protein
MNFPDGLTIVEHEKRVGGNQEFLTEHLSNE